MTSQEKETTHGAATKRARPLRVLCAEDDKHVAMMLRLALEHGGHHVEVVYDGNRALDCIASSPEAFDVLVTDNEMPELSGVHLVEKLRATNFAGKIVVHSSELHARDSAAYRALGVDFILTKPARLDLFLTVVEKAGGVAP